MIDKQTMIKGAMILMVANLTTRIIGMFFRIPLARILDEEGMGLFGVAYQIYTFMFIIVATGFPIAISKMVAETNAKSLGGDSSNVRRVFQTAALLLGFVGMLGSAVLFFFAEPLASLFGAPAAKYGIMAISPAVFFISLVSAHRGYFQGHQNMYPTAASEVIEATSRLLIGILMATFVMSLHYSVPANFVGRFIPGIQATETVQLELASAGALLGGPIGMIIVLMILMTIYSLTRKKRVKSIAPLRSRLSITKELILIAIPITIGAAVMSLTGLIDLATVMNRLQVNPDVFNAYPAVTEGAAFAGYYGTALIERQARALYGMYTGFAFPLFNIPMTFIVAISITIVPAIAAALESGKNERAREIVHTAIRVTLLLALPAAVGMSVLAEPLLFLIFNNANAAPLLQILAISVVFVSLVHVTNAMLQSYGKVKIPVYTMLVGGLAKVLINYFLIPVWGIDAAPFSTIICYAIIVILNIICLAKHVKLSFNVAKNFISPALSAVIMGVCALFAHRFLSQMISPRLATVAAIGVAGIIYVFLIFITRAVEREDVEMLPLGKRIAAKIYR